MCAERKLKVTPERIELGEGVALNIIPCNKFKTNCITVRFLCPMAEETAAHNALLPYVLKRGCERLPNMAEIAKELQMLYGSEMSAHVGKMGNTQFFGFTSYPLSDTYTEGVNVSDKILSLMAEMLKSPLLENGCLKSEYVQSEKKVLSDRVKEAINNKTMYAVKRCFEEMGKGDPSSLSEIGTLEQIDKITPETLTETLKNVLESYRIEIWCAGVFDKERLTDTCKKLFVKQNRRPCASMNVSTIKEASALNRVVEDQPVKQGKLSIGFTTSLCPEGDQAGIYNLFLEVLANSPTAKLFMNVREKMSLCYYCAAIPDKLKGTLIITSGIEADKAETAEKAILNELEKCKNGDISETELDAAKKALLNSAKSIFDDYGALIGWYFSQLTWKKNVSPVEYAEKAMKATTKDLTDVANTLKLHTVYFLNGTLNGEEE